MVDEKSIVKMNKMIHKKTGSSFLIVYVIYVSFVYTDSKKTASCLLPRHTIFATFGRQLKCLLVGIQGSLYLFHYVLDDLNWLLIVFLSNLIINLQSVSWSLAEFRHNKIVQSPHENYFNVCRQHKEK